MALLGASRGGAGRRTLMRAGRLPLADLVWVPILAVLFAPLVFYGAVDTPAGLALAASQLLLGAGFLVLAAFGVGSLRLGPWVLGAAFAFLALIVLQTALATPVRETGGLAALLHLPWPANSDGLTPAPGVLVLDRYASHVELLKLAGLAGAAVIGLFAGSRRHRAERIWTLLLFAAGAYGLWAVASFLSAPDQLFGQPKPYHDNRLTASFLSANTAASVFGVFACLAFVETLLAAGNINPRGDRYAVAERLFVRVGPKACVLLVCLCALLLTTSRGGASAAGVGLLVSAVLLFVRRPSEGGAPPKRVAAVTLAMAALAAAMAAIAAARFFARGAENSNIDLRGALLSEYWARLPETPLTGYGLGSFRAVNSAVTTPESFGTLQGLGALHNLYLQWLLEAGPVGSVLMTAAVLCLLAAATIGGGSDRAATVRRAGVAGASVALLIHNTFDYSLEVPAVAGLWAFLLGFATAQARRLRSPKVRAAKDQDERQPSSRIAHRIRQPL